MIFDELYEDTLSSVARAVKSQNIQQLQELLQKGHPTNITDNRGWTPLHVAASEGCVAAVRHLLTADDIQVESLSHCGLSPLCLACFDKTKRHRKVVELLLSAEADPNMTSGDKWVVPLHIATENNNLEVVRLLLDAGADPNITAYKNTSALHATAQVGALEIAQLLVDKGGDLNISHESSELSVLHCLCLHYKQDCGDPYNEMLELFLSHGSNVNARTLDGTTPLMLAVQRRWNWAVNKLLDHQADVYLTKSNNILALHFAIQFSDDAPDKRTDDGEEHKDSSVLQKILSRTSCDKIPREGFSIFHLGIQWKRYKGLCMLIENGLNPDEFLQEMESAIIDCDESFAVPLIVELKISHDTPLGFLLFQSLSREVVDTAKYMIDKGSSINALRPGVLPPLVAALKNRHPTAYLEDSLSQEILQYLLVRGVDITYKINDNDLLPAALMVSSLFNVVGFFRLLQHGVAAHHVYTRPTFTALLNYYQNMRIYKAYKLFPWLVVSWLCTVNLFIAQLPFDTVDIFNKNWEVEDENLAQAWQQLEEFVTSPKSLQHLCGLSVRRVLGEARGWQHLQDSLSDLQTHTVLPDPIIDLLYFKWVKANTLQLNPPTSAKHLYATAVMSESSDDEV